MLKAKKQCVSALDLDGGGCLIQGGPSHWSNRLVSNVLRLEMGVTYPMSLSARQP